MMKKLLFAGSLLAVTGLTASAQLTSVEGDLILSFYTANATSVGATAYTVNLGTSTTYRTSTPSGMIVDLGTDLTTAFGASWASNTDLKMSLATGWSSIATPSSPDAARTIYYTATSVGTNSWAFGTSVEGTDKTTVAPTVTVPLSSSGYNSWATALSGYAAAQDFAANGALVSNSAIIDTTSTPNDITNLVTPSTPGVWFGKPYPTANIGDYGNNFVFAVDLWVTDKATQSTGTYLGTFGLNNAGEFGQIAVPEPSMLVVSALGLGALAYIRSRRKNASK